MCLAAPSLHYITVDLVFSDFSIRFVVKPNAKNSMAPWLQAYVHCVHVYLLFYDILTVVYKCKNLEHPPDTSMIRTPNTSMKWPPNTSMKRQSYWLLSQHSTHVSVKECCFGAGIQVILKINKINVTIYWHV